jgi:hypothetical protein
MDDAPHGDGDMEHEGPKDNQNDGDSKFGSQNDEEKEANTGGTTVSVPHHANMLELSPIKFGMLKPLDHMIESPMVTFSRSVYEHIKENLGKRETSAYVLEEQSDSVVTQTMNGVLPEGLPEEMVESQPQMFDGTTLMKEAQPDLHGITMIGALHATLITATEDDTAMLAVASQRADSAMMVGYGCADDEEDLLTPVLTPVGANKVQSVALFHDNDNDHLNSAFSFSNKCLSSKVAGNFPSGKPSMTEVMNFGGITPNIVKDVRSSARLSAQPNADVSQMERAMMLASKRDDDQAKGTQPSKIPSFSAFSDEQIVANANAIGVSMGKNLDDSLKAARLIKDIETNRMLTFLNASNNFVNEDSMMVPTCLAVSRASMLCDDLDEEDQFLGDHTSQILIPNRENKQQRKKRSYDKTKIQRSERIKLKRNN